MTADATIPRYVSPCTMKSLWQEYRIYEDHLELATHFGTLHVPFSEIERMTVAPSDVKELVTKGELHLKNFRPALKLDWANFLDHVVLDTTEGRVQRILFTPEDPHAFLKAFETAHEKFLGAQAG
jgi:hypothetical protein